MSKTPGILGSPASGTPGIPNSLVSRMPGSHFKTWITPWKVAKIKNGSNSTRRSCLVKNPTLKISFYSLFYRSQCFMRGEGSAMQLSAPSLIILEYRGMYHFSIFMSEVKILWNRDFGFHVISFRYPVPTYFAFKIKWLFCAVRMPSRMQWFLFFYISKE